MKAPTLSLGKDAPPPGRRYNREDSEAPEGVFFGSILQLSFWQPDLDQIGFSAFHNFVEQICGLRKQIKSTFLFDIIKNMTCRLEMNLPGLVIISMETESFLLKGFFKKYIYSYKDL